MKLKIKTDGEATHFAKNRPLTRRQILSHLMTIAIFSPMFNQQVFAATAARDTGQSMRRKRIFLTGSPSGLGEMAAQLLINQGPQVILHGRSPARANEALKQTPGAVNAVYGDFNSLRQVRGLADQVNKLGHIDAIIHNAGIGDDESTKTLSEDGFPQVFAVNTLAPYVLTALITRPQRLIYITSSMQFSANGQTCLDDLLWEKRTWQGATAYSESKLLDSMLAFAIARRWQGVLSNTVDPGWVPTRMGGSYATDDLNQGYPTQSWLAVSDDPQAKVTGRHFYHMELRETNPDALKPELQDRLITQCEHLSGIALPT